MKRTLYVSDLDGTLLRSDVQISEQSCEIINDLVNRGMIFSYATARSIHTASVATQGLNAKMPLILYNGAFVLDSQTRERMITNAFPDRQAREIYRLLCEGGVSPVVYSVIGEAEKFSYCAHEVSRMTKNFLDTRRDDGRDRPLKTESGILDGEMFYFLCIDEEEKLEPLYQKLRETCVCIYQKDIYSGDPWLEIMPLAATKAQAALKLKELYQCDRLVCFGDGINDLSMFEIADECYAMSNAVDELKQRATAVIGSNEEDGVALWLKEHAEF